MYTKVYITGLGGVFGGAIGLSDIWNTMNGPQSAPQELATVIEMLPFSLDGLHPSLGKALVRVVPKTDAELAAHAGVRAKDFDRHQLLAFIAAQEAMQSIPHRNGARFACIGATGGAGLNEIHATEKQLLLGRRASPKANLKHLSNTFVGYLTQMFGLEAASHMHGTACAAGTHAITDAVRLLKYGEADKVLVVGTEAAISPYGIAKFQSQRALGNGRAFDTNRSGFVMGEGAAALVLEAEDTMRKRDIEPYARIAGFGESSDAVSGGQITDPHPEGGARAARIAIETAGWSRRDVEYVNAHGTGTPLGDAAEISGISFWKGSEKLMVSSSKSAIGHLLGAAGGAEAALCALMLQKGCILPTWGLRHIDPMCAGVDHVRETRTVRCSRILSQSFGFGGTNAALALERT